MSMTYLLDSAGNFLTDAAGNRLTTDGPVLSVTITPMTVLTTNTIIAPVVSKPPVKGRGHK